MKLKATVLIVLVAAVVALFAAKGIKSGSAPEEYSSNTASQTASLIEEAKQKGQPAWLLFHSTTCQSCIEMEAVYNALKPEFEGKVAFININVNDPAEQDLCVQYQIQYIPTTFFLNSKGEITFNYVGVIQQDEMRAKLKELAEGK
ncbi:thioredoxin family protein [Thermincola potens]|uniref:Thioredoxin domain protein n=1 Tax=Thermincola potens (strain JR) TaxID=635013 RepID=D5XB29_THEPJ|nr:thioredoxin domain-containing protein [Thermincola potens]ADG81349.1 Thioredoxin domain protein [Thermincola potens JR]